MLSNIFGTKKNTEFSGPIKNEVINKVVTELNKQPEFFKVEVTKDYDVTFSLEEEHRVSFVVNFTLNGYDGGHIYNGMTGHHPDGFDYTKDRRDLSRTEAKDIIWYMLDQAVVFLEREARKTTKPLLSRIEHVKVLRDQYSK